MAELGRCFPTTCIFLEEEKKEEFIEEEAFVDKSTNLSDKFRRRSFESTRNSRTKIKITFKLLNEARKDSSILPLFSIHLFLFFFFSIFFSILERSVGDLSFNGGIIASAWKGKPPREGRANSVRS